MGSHRVGHDWCDLAAAPALSWTCQHNGTQFKEESDHRAFIHLWGNSKNRQVNKDNIKKWSGIFFLNSTVIELSVIKQVQGGGTHYTKWNDQQILLEKYLQDHNYENEPAMKNLLWIQWRKRV